MNSDNTYVFSQLHIDLARNSTDDFNLFHDSKNYKILSRARKRWDFNWNH